MSNLLIAPTEPTDFTIRQSTLEMAKCLHRFHQHDILRVPQADTEASLRGVDFHALAADYVTHLKVEELPTDYEYAEMIAAKVPGEGGKLFLSWVQERVFDPDHIWRAEVQIVLSWTLQSVSPETPKHLAPFRGTLDRVELDGDQADIWDMKTYFKVYSPDTIQALFYPWLLWRLMPGLKVIRFHLDFVRWNVVRSRTFTVEEIQEREAEIFQLVRRVVSAIEAKEFPATVNSNCTYCSLKCPLVEEGLSRSVVGKIEDDSEAHDLAEMMFALENRAARMKTVLSNYIARRGQIELTDHILAFQKREKWKYPVQRVMELNENFSFPKHHALRPDANQIKRTAKEHPDFLAALKPSAKDESTTVLAFKKKEKPPDEDPEVEDEEF